MSDILNFLSKRRSVTAKRMSEGTVLDDHLQLILNAGLRVPDHGGVKPWKICVIKGESRKIFDEKIILKEFKKNNKNASEELIKMESSRFQRAHTIIAILSTPELDHKVPEWEQVLSAGAVCTTILYAAQSFDYAAQWVTEWYAYNKKIIKELGGNPIKDKIAGFIYIGSKNKEPKERIRPNKDMHITYY
jgi:nitroreductase